MHVVTCLHGSQHSLLVELRDKSLHNTIKDLRNEDVMKRRKIFAFVLLLSLFPLSCASNQASNHALSEAERIVELYVPGCRG